ncbi:hypothetical protein BJV78DRAFT_1284953 [Lactifluus subvellereus]|nr:hypothetical protein BJV78DRAFT_1284953 [Lactifluus subvellereus]
MASPLRSINSLVLFYLFLILTIVPLPVSSLPIPTSSSTRIGGRLIFDIVFALSLFLVLIGSLYWVRSRMTVDRFLGGISHLLATSVALAEQLHYLSFTTLLSVVARTVLDTSDDVNDAPTHRRGGLSNPMSTVSRIRSHIGRIGGEAASAQGGAVPDPNGSATPV